MLKAKKFQCTVSSLIWLSQTVFELRFKTNKQIKFEPGQFLSLYVPDFLNEGKFVRRAYSFANALRDVKEQNYALCVKHQVGGAGSEFLCSLKPGDNFEATAPYGHFFQVPNPERNICFVSTSTGIAPVRSILRSEEFQEHKPKKVLHLFGARTEDEILYAGEFPDIECITAVSRPTPNFRGFHGRVTDYLRSLPASWAWQKTDFYLCGNGAMVAEVVEILRDGHGVADSAIRRESFSPAKKKSA
jgi:ferredoxin-NADP reductase